MKRFNRKPVKFVILNEVKNLFPLKMVRLFAYFQQVQNDRRKQSGVTLMEMTVVVAIVASLAVIAVPGVRMLFNSMESDGSRAMISAAIASARAMAAEKQEYVGVRFQRNYNPGDPDKTSQYIIFIIHDPNKTGLANSFRAVDNVKPIKLPDNIGVMDMSAIGANSDIDTTDEFNNATTFSIVFSPSGKLIIHDVWVINKDGYCDIDPNSSNDNIFNKDEKVNAGEAMFYQDDYSLLGFQNELSRNSFVIYDKVIFDKIAVNKRWSDYLSKLVKINLNSYTGGIISTN
jgi:prepilin-type N-terminal cleavage/methylation domain-containing protein